MSNYLVITGGSRGIGKECISIFANNGWKILNISRTDCDLPGVMNFNIDLCDPDWPTTFGTHLLEKVADAKQICLVHNAAAFKQDNIRELDSEALREVLEFNIVSPQALNKLLIPKMHAGSSIIYIGTTLSEMAVPNRASYVITKHALVGMMRSTCQDLAGKNITTCCVCPGFVNTSMLTSQVEEKMLNDIIKGRVTAGRLIEPREISDLVYFCAHNPVINGSVIHANLGQITN